MEKQVLVISYVGEKPTQEQAVNAVVALKKSGCYIDTTVDPNICHLSEEQQAQAMAAFAKRKIANGKGITITVKNEEPKMTAEKVQQLAKVLRDFFDE